MSIPKTAQSPLQCDSENCGNTSGFYCNNCHQRLCKQCRNEHLKSSINKEHQVVLYKNRTRQFLSEKCKVHHLKDIDLLCRECQLPLCSKCTTTQEHRGHTFTDLEHIYAEKYLFCQREIVKVHEYFLPTSQNLQKEIKEDAMKLKMIMDKIRSSMRTEAEFLKGMVDALVSQNVEEVNKIEHSLMKILQDDEKKIDGYVAYLNDLIREFYRYPIYTKPTELISAGDIKLQIQPIPEIPKLATPVFTAGQQWKEDIVKLLGKIKVPNKVTEKREIKPMIPTSSLVKVREYNVPDVENAFHMSLSTQGSLLVSDRSGNLILTDLQQNRLQKIKTNTCDTGYHTITRDGDLMFTMKNEKQIKKIKLNNKTTEYIKTHWKPISIHSSNVNNDILVGMVSDDNAKVTKFNKKGETKNFEEDLRLYCYPHYITENINGDICTSDLYRKAVVVVNTSGRHRFSYKGQKARFYPFGICSDILGHIIVCDAVSDTVHLLDQDGHFLSVLPTREHEVWRPRCVCVDISNNLYIGQRDINTISVFKCLS